MTFTKPVRIPLSLEEEFNTLPNRQRWGSANSAFADFVREALRYYLDYQRDRSQMIIYEGKEEDEKGQGGNP